MNLTATTHYTCESQSQDQNSPVPELSATTITKSLVLHLHHRTK